MRRSKSVALALALLALPAVAVATVTEPSGLQVPLDSMNGEVQLYTLFSQVGDPVDWQTDAASTPNMFSPLCGFTATFLLHESACTMDFAWYNETGSPPQPSDLHVIIPAGSAVGQTFTGTDIKNDPAYAGGLVGFAIVANGFCSQTHYANPAWNPEYSAGTPWFTTMIYPSKNTPNAYYLAYEDGPMSGTSFGNDGDFNDDVFFISGVTCSGGGQPCDTGLPGICGPGVTQCTPNGVVCQGVSGMMNETCNGLDDNCNGATDDDAMCPPGKVCDHGACVAQCGTEFPCLNGTVCNASGVCVEPACQMANCDMGTVCIGGVCKAPCDDVVCPFGEVCRNGACVDPCVGVTCDANTQVCEAGVCVAKCSCLPCAATDTCDMATNHCVETSCLGKACNPGEHCAGGACVDDCQGAACPSGQVCMQGECVAAPTMTTSSDASSGALQPATTTTGDATATSSSGSASTASGAASGGAGGGSGSGSGASGCGCRVDGRDAPSGVALFGLAIAAVALRRRKA